MFRLPITKSQIDWERNNPDLASKYPNVYGYFAPPRKPGEQPDPTAYARQIRNDQRVSLSSETWNQLANDKIGWFLYDRLKKKAGDKPTPAQRDILSNYHAELQKAFPGFDTDIRGLPARAHIEDVATELGRAVKDPKLAESLPAAGVAAYLKVRKAAIAKANAMGIKGWQTANKTQGIRRALDNYQTELRNEVPETAAVFDIVFRNDVRNLGAK
jgi:hypothetical protein